MGREEEEKRPSGSVVNEEMPQEKHQPGPWRLCNKWYYLENLQDPLDRTDG